MSKRPRHPSRVDLPDVEPIHEHGRWSATKLGSGLRLPCVSWWRGMALKYGVVDNADVPIVCNADQPVITNY